MAKIYTRCGKNSDAIATIDHLLSLGSYFTVNDFKLAREFDPLRDAPRFKDLMKKYSRDTNVL